MAEDSHTNPVAFESGAPRSRGLSLFRRWQSAWNDSLRFRLIALSLMPLLIAFPFVVGAIVLVGGGTANTMLLSNLQSNLGGARNYLDQLKTDVGGRVGQLVKSERLIQLVLHPADNQDLNQLLATAAKGSGLDFLIVAGPEGTVLASSTGVARGSRLPDSHVIRQARIGVANAGYERIAALDLAAFSPLFPAQAYVAHVHPPQERPPPAETNGLLINAAAHFPLSVSQTDAVLVGGILLNNNSSLIEHMREIIFPVGTLPGNAEGMTSIHTDEVSIAISRQRQQGQRTAGTRIRPDIAAVVIGNGQPWLGKIEFAGLSNMEGYEPIVDGEGQRIGMISAGFPDAPYRRGFLWLLTMIVGLLALTMLVLSIVFLRAGRELTHRLASIGATMSRVGAGDRDARAGLPLRNDELGRLTRHFDVLLDTIANQDAMQRAAQQMIADEALRRRALFEHERDGVVILNADGSVFESNPKTAAMLGYTSEEFNRSRLSDWDAHFSAAELASLMQEMGPQGSFFETVHRRKDGSTYPAEVSASRAEWAGKSFVLILHRDISQRKAAEAELEKYRIDLEKLVDLRTKELHDRSEQLDTIFTLSPDGFVSFDQQHRVAFVNLAFQRMTGIDDHDIMGLDEKEFSAQLARKCLASAGFPGVTQMRAVRKKVREAGGRGNPVRRQLIELSAPETRVLEVSIRIGEAQSVSQILYFHDVTLETEVERMKSEFLSTAAHELRTPMASIYGFAELLMTQEFDPPTQQEFLSTIFLQSELMASIINELLDLARIEARGGKDFVIKRCSVHDIVALAVASYKLPSARLPPIMLDSGASLFINADLQKMQQALLNILSNAYKYSPNGGDVMIDCRLEEHNGLGRAVVEIKDHGLGMTDKQQGHVFERFYRADTSGKIPGTGLGLSIVKEIIELHGGQVSVASEFGVGTTVTFWIPLA